VSGGCGIEHIARADDAGGVPGRGERRRQRTCSSPAGAASGGDYTRFNELTRVREVGSRESGLAVVIAHRADGSPYASVVNAGVLLHPVSDNEIVGFVARGGSRKLPNLPRDPRVTVVFRSGWDWVAVEGTAELVGPDDPITGVESADIPRLLRAVYAAAVGGDLDDWRTLDQEMADEGHTAGLVTPHRRYSGVP
jgi:PPOX class probable F420-dependent enzyme